MGEFLLAAIRHPAVQFSAELAFTILAAVLADQMITKIRLVNNETEKLLQSAGLSGINTIRSLA